MIKYIIFNLGIIFQVKVAWVRICTNIFLLTCSGSGLTCLPREKQPFERQIPVNWEKSGAAALHSKCNLSYLHTHSGSGRGEATLYGGKCLFQGHLLTWAHLKRQGFIKVSLTAFIAFPANTTKNWNLNSKVYQQYRIFACVPKRTCHCHLMILVAGIFFAALQPASFLWISRKRFHQHIWEKWTKEGHKYLVQSFCILFFFFPV